MPAIVFLAISPVRDPDFPCALLEQKLLNRKQLGPAFAYLNGAESRLNAEQLTFIYNSARREVEIKGRENTKSYFMRPISCPNAAQPV